MKYIKSIFAAALIMCLLSTISFAQEKEMMKKDEMKKDMMHDKMMKNEMTMKIDKDMNGVAIKGYDPVAYFTDHKPMMGDKMYSYNWSGAVWQFANEKHLNLFKENPDKYAPCYGGYCAYGVSKNALFSTDPKVWKIVDGKLYLNKNEDIGKLFNKDVKGAVIEADKNWKGLNKYDKK